MGKNKEPLRVKRGTKNKSCTTKWVGEKSRWVAGWAEVGWRQGNWHRAIKITSCPLPPFMVNNTINTCLRMTPATRQDLCSFSCLPSWHPSLLILRAAKSISQTCEHATYGCNYAVYLSRFLPIKYYFGLYAFYNQLWMILN